MRARRAAALGREGVALVGAVVLALGCGGCVPAERPEVAQLRFVDRTATVELRRFRGLQPTRVNHFLRQVRRQVRTVLCGGTRAACPAFAGELRVVTTLDLRAQAIVEHWIRHAIRPPVSSGEGQGGDDASPARREEPGEPHAPFPRPGAEDDAAWLATLRTQRIRNGAGAVLDYRSGAVLAYLGSADPSATVATPEFQPQFDVLSHGWRQPGSAIKPLSYVLGIDARRFTAATVFMDVVTDFTGEGFAPTQADGLERGPVRARQALQFSLNVPAVKASYRNGLDRLFAATERWGIAYRPDAEPVPSMALGTLESRPIDLLSAYGALANGGRLVPRRYVRQIFDAEGVLLWSAEREPRGRQVASAGAAFIVADILAENTDPARNPRWGRWAVRAGDRRRPAAYKTGTTDRSVDLQAYGFVAPPVDPLAPAFAVGVWLGNSDASSTGTLDALETAAPLWSGIVSALALETPIADFRPPEGLAQICVDVHSGLLPGPHTTHCVPEYFLAGTEPSRPDDTKRSLDIDAATGARWVDGCAGPRVSEVFLDLGVLEADRPAWHTANRAWSMRAAYGAGRRGGPRATATAYFYDERGAAPDGTTWGAPFAPWVTCDRLTPVRESGRAEEGRIDVD